MDISIIIPCYNAIGKIEACIASLKKIDYQNSKYEIIFIDDCSQDNTFQYLTQLSKENQNWSVLQTKENTGSPSEPRNIGTSAAKGEYIFFLDCDDEIYSDTLNIHFKTAKSKNADIVRGYLTIDNGNEQLPANRIFDSLENLSKEEKIKIILGKQSTTVPSLIKRSLLNKNNISWHSDLRMGEDTIFLIEVLAAAKNIIYIDHPTFIYNKKINAEASSTQSYGSRELNNHLAVWTTAQERLSKIGINYYNIRLQVGLQTAIQAMINYNKFDITENDFKKLSTFIIDNKKIIEKFNYSQRIKQILETIYNKNYHNFLEQIKMRLVIAGYDLKFIKTAIPALKEYYQIQIDEWTGHNTHNEQQSEECLKWADIVFCEWMLGNAVWYSHRIKNNQKLFIRMHRFELRTPWFNQIDFTKVNRVFAVSLYFFEKLVEYTKIPRSLAALLPNYLDSKNYETSNKKEKLFNIGIIGILPSRKGYLNTLKILKALVNKNKKYKLYVYGKMPEDLSWVKNDKKEMSYFEECNKFITENNLQSHVIIKGWVDIRKELKNIGFILSTSHNEEIPESFHIAPSDSFSAGNQGVLLNWNGVEYIYPEKYIFGSIEEITNHILHQNTLNKFDKYNQDGIKLIAERYSLSNFITNLRKQMKLSEIRFSSAPSPKNQEETTTKLIYEIKDAELTYKGINLPLPKEARSNCKLMLEYSLSCSENTKTNAALISISSNDNNIPGFKPSDVKELGVYKYLNTSVDNNTFYTEIPLTKENHIEEIKLVLWQKDAKIKILSAKLFAIQ